MEDIFRILEKDARTTPERIAQMTGRSVEEVRAAIKKAEEDSVILGYRAKVNWDKVAQGRILALIEVKVTPQREVGFDAVAARIARYPEVRSLYLLSGDYDLAVQVEGDSIYEISDFVSNKLAIIDAVQGTVTHFLLKRFKEDGFIIQGEDGTSKRLPIAP